MFKFICPRFIFKIEKWKWNKEYRLYVSNMGHFLDEHKQPRPVKMGSTGYIIIKTRNGYVPAHRLVMKTWKPTEDMDNLTVDHLDHNKRNNCVDNLEWVTDKINKERARRDFVVVKEDNNSVIVPKGDPNYNKMKKNTMKRYSRTNYTLDDIEWFVVNDEKFPTLAEAHAYSVLLIKKCECEKEKGPSVCLDDVTIENIQNRYQTLINRAKVKEAKIIDGKAGIKAFKYLNFKIIIKKQEDEV